MGITIISWLSFLVLLASHIYSEVDGQYNDAPNSAMNLVLFGDTWISPEFQTYGAEFKVSNEKESLSNEKLELKKVDVNNKSFMQSAQVGTAYSDGPNWVEYVSQVLGNKQKINVITFAQPEAAIVDGTIDDGNVLAKKNNVRELVSLSNQIELYNMHSAKSLDQNKTVSVISIGMNDIIYRMDTLKKAHKIWTQYYMYYTSKELCSNIESLLQGGTRNILVIGPGHLALYPGIISSNMVTNVLAADTVSYMLNNRAKKCVEKIMNFYNKSRESLKVTDFDHNEHNKNPVVLYLSLYDILEEISKKHETLGIKVINEPCINDNNSSSNSKGATGICNNPEEHLFWDEMHFSTRVQKHLSVQILHKLKLMITENTNDDFHKTNEEGEYVRKQSKLNQTFKIKHAGKTNNNHSKKHNLIKRTPEKAFSDASQKGMPQNTTLKGDASQKNELQVKALPFLNTPQDPVNDTKSVNEKDHITDTSQNSIISLTDKKQGQVQDSKSINAVAQPTDIIQNTTLTLLPDAKQDQTQDFKSNNPNAEPMNTPQKEIPSPLDVKQDQVQAFKNSNSNAEPMNAPQKAITSPSDVKEDQVLNISKSEDTGSMETDLPGENTPLTEAATSNNPTTTTIPSSVEPHVSDDFHQYKEGTLPMGVDELVVINAAGGVPKNIPKPPEFSSLNSIHPSVNVNMSDSINIYPSLEYINRGLL